MTKAAEVDDEKSSGKANGGMEVKNYRPFAAPIKKVNPVDYIFRALTVQVKHHHEKGARTMVDVMKETYGEDDKTYAMMNIICRAATVPARTDTTTWAQELVTVAIGDFFDLLQPVSIYANISALGGRFTFGRNGVIAIPTRSSTPTLAGAFVGQGNPIRRRWSPRICPLDRTGGETPCNSAPASWGSDHRAYPCSASPNDRCSEAPRSDEAHRSTKIP